MKHASLLLALGGVSAKSPLAAITDTLKDYQANLKAAEATDKGLYDKYQCACKKELPSTEKAISEAEQCIVDSQNEFDSKTALAKKLDGEIKKGEKLMQESKDEITRLQVDRQKMTEEWNKTNAELTKVISALGSALEVLKNKQAKMFLQSDRTKVDAEFLIIKQFAENLPSRMADILTSVQRNSVVEFLQAPSYAAYTSQTGGIIGILSNMEDTVTADLKDAQETYDTSLQSNKQREAATQKILDDTTADVAVKKGRKSEAESAAADAKVQNEQCKSTLTSEQERIADLKESCQKNVNDFQTRSSKRNSEIQAINKALDLFTSDRVRKMFETKKNNDAAPSFIQMSATKKRHLKEASALLKDAASKYGDNKLAIFAKELSFVSVNKSANTKKGGVFANICKKITDFQTALETEKADWENFVADCVSSTNQYKNEVDDLNNTIAATEASIAKTETEISTLEDRINEKKDAIADTKDNLGQATASRQAAHEEFLAEHENNAQAVEVLKEGHRILKLEYQPQFLQQPDAEEFASYQKQDGSAVLGMLETLQTKTEDQMADAVEQENEEQKIYDHLVKDLNETIKNLISEKVTAEGKKANAEKKLSELNDKLDATTDVRDETAESLEHKKKNCAFKQTHLKTKVEKVDAEVSVLIQVRDILCA